MFYPAKKKKNCVRLNNYHVKIIFRLKYMNIFVRVFFLNNNSKNKYAIRVFCKIKQRSTPL